jgi:hypothetical protein
MLSGVLMMIPTSRTSSEEETLRPGGEHGVEMAARQTAGQPWGTAVLAANANSHAPHATSSGFARPRIAKAAGFLVYPA